MNENKSIAIKKDSLASLTVFGNKNKEGTGEEFKVHFLDDDVGKGIMAFPHIHIIGIKKNGVLRIKNHEANCRCYEINRPGGVFDQRTSTLTVGAVALFHGPRQGPYIMEVAKAWPKIQRIQKIGPLFWRFMIPLKKRKFYYFKDLDGKRSRNLLFL